MIFYEKYIFFTNSIVGSRFLPADDGICSCWNSRCINSAHCELYESIRFRVYTNELI